MSKVIHFTLVSRSVLPTLAHTEPADVTARNEVVIRENLEKINRGDAKGAAADWARLPRISADPCAARMCRARSKISSTSSRLSHGIWKWS